MSSQEEPDFDRLPQDPLGFFGLGADFDPKDLRRRYTRLIRRFKPERDPEAFQKIRSAYEALKAWRGMGGGDASHETPMFPDGGAAATDPRDGARSEDPGPTGGSLESRLAGRRRVLQEEGPGGLLEFLREGRAHEAADLLLRGALRAHLGEGPEALLSEWLEAPRAMGWSGADLAFFQRAAESVPSARLAPWIDRIHRELPGETAVFVARPLWIRLGESGAGAEVESLHDRWLTKESEVGQVARAELSLEVVRSILWTGDLDWLEARLIQLRDLELLVESSDRGRFGGARWFWLGRLLCEAILDYRRGWGSAEDRDPIDGSVDIDGSVGADPRDRLRPLKPLRDRLRGLVREVARNPRPDHGHGSELETFLLRMRLDPETILEEWEPTDPELRDLERTLLLASVERADALGLDLALEEQRLVAGSPRAHGFSRFVAELTRASRGRLELIVLPRANLGAILLLFLGIMVLGGYLGRTLGAQLDVSWGRAVVSLGVILGLGGWIARLFLGDASPYRRLEHLWSARLYRVLWRPQLIEFMMRSPLPPRVLTVEFEDRGFAAAQGGGRDRFAVIGERLAAQVRADPALELLWIAQCFGGCSFDVGEEHFGDTGADPILGEEDERAPLLGESDERSV